MMWQKIKLKTLITQPLQNGYSPICPEIPNGKWILSLGALNGSGFDANKVKPAPIGDKRVDAFLLKTGDFLISRSNTPEKVGRGALFKGQIDNCSYPDLMMRFRIDEQKIYPAYLEMYLTSSEAGRYFQNAASGTSESMVKINKSIVENLQIPSPPLKEQIVIASLLSTWDLALEKIERLIAAKQKQLAVLRERLLHKPPRSKRIKLHEATRESTARNGARLDRDAIMAVTKKVGMRPMKEETIAANIERYKVVRPNGFAYNPMRLNIGSIAMSPFDADILVSPDYVVFECDESKLLPGYLNHLRFSRHWTNYFENAGNGSVRVRIYYDDLSAFAFELPPVEEQERIVGFLDAVQLEIDLLKKQAEAYRRQKRGLMQKLLTGEWRVRLG